MKTTRRSIDEDVLVRGSLITMRRRCGKPSCRCARGEPHETPALSYRVGGSTKMLTFRSEDLPTVKAAVARYRKARAELDKRATHGITALRAHIADQKADHGVRARKGVRA
jgi:hypothetical protein